MEKFIDDFFNGNIRQIIPGLQCTPGLFVFFSGGTVTPERQV